MTPESLDRSRLAVAEGGAERSAAACVDKLRIRFRKDGALRFVGHNDLMRLWDRALRRAQAPVRFSQGYHPMPRLSSPLSLGLGIVGVEEVLDVELIERVDVCELHSRLDAALVGGLSIVGIERVAKQERAAVVEVEYSTALPPNACIAELTARRDTVLASTTAVVSRARPDGPTRKLDIRPWILAILVTSDTLRFRIRVTPSGTARAEEVLRLLGVEHWLEEGVVLSRTRVVLDSKPSPGARRDSPIEGK